MKKPLRFLVSGLMAAGMFASGAAQARSLTICSDVNFWYPFTMVEDGKAVGIHIDIIKMAVEKLGYQVEFKPLPWKRCLTEAEEGKVDGIAVASYNAERAAFLRYPDDAATNPTSDLRVASVEYVVVTAASSDYEFNGDVKTIPQPVMAPRGWSIVGELEKQGVTVDSNATGDENNLRKLLRSGDGAIVTIPEVIRQLGDKPDFKGKFKVSAKPVSSRAYYLPFAKKGSVDEATGDKVWQEIKAIREDQGKMAGIAAKY